jgi:hypothetical protein
MRKAFGYFALGAAVVIVAYSAGTLFNSAFHSMKDSWQQWQTAIGAAAVVLWEATAISLIGWAWHRGYKPVAVLGVPLLVLACLVSLFWESSLLTSGQSDHYAERNAMVEAKAGTQQDLAWFRERRNSLKTSKPSPAIARELAWIDGRITELQLAKASIAISDASPQASWLARLTGLPMQMAADVSLLVVLLFWMLARVVAVPLAQSAFIPQKQDASTPISIASDRPDLSRIAQKPISIDASTAISMPEPVLASPRPAQHAMPDASNVTLLRRSPDVASVKKKTTGPGSVTDWLGECTSQEADKKTTATHSECRSSYLSWCASKGLHPVGARIMTRQMRTLLRCSARNGSGAVFPGLRVFQPSAGSLRA